jgi:hypothetical protein
MPFSLIPRLPTSPPLSRFPTPMPQQLVEKSPRSASSFLGTDNRPGHPRAHFRGTDDRPGHPRTHFEVRMTVRGHPRTSETLVRTIQALQFKL